MILKTVIHEMLIFIVNLFYQALLHEFGHFILHTFQALIGNQILSKLLGREEQI